MKYNIIIRASIENNFLISNKLNFYGILKYVRYTIFMSLFMKVITRFIDRIQEPVDMGDVSQREIIAHVLYHSVIVIVRVQYANGSNERKSL